MNGGRREGMHFPNLGEQKHKTEWLSSQGGICFDMTSLFVLHLINDRIFFFF